MDNSKNINCPQCGIEIDVNAILYRKVDDAIKLKYRTALEQEKKKYEDDRKKSYKTTSHSE